MASRVYAALLVSDSGKLSASIGFRRQEVARNAVGR
jgi:hypothetical protein